MLNRILSSLVLAIVFILVSACAGQQIRSKSSVVDYLYPGSGTQVVKPSIPHLNIPVNVGIAFVPEQSTRSSGFTMWSGRVNRGGEFTEAKKTALLDQVANHFKDYDFVKNIEVIPTAYLTPGGGFTNLDQIKTMYGIDVIALVSYDQAQFTDEGFLSLTYWTLVGAYIVSGEKNDTNTLMDTAVFDISSRKMLFRAPGISKIKGSSTAVNLSEELRVDSEEGFQKATEDMIANLDTQLNRFKDKLKENLKRQKEERYTEAEKKPVATVTYDTDYKGGGGGSFAGLDVIFLLVVSFFYIRSKGAIK